MKLHPIHTGNFKLDGGAMFGVVPKSIWDRKHPADANNMCTWAMRCLLIEDGDRLILIDNGIGDKQDEKFFSYYYLHGDQSLVGSLKMAGFSVADITDVFLTHLHFDHCGGSVKWNKERTGLVPVFPNATYWSHEAHWNWATRPNPREKASFLQENIMPIKESGQLKFVGSTSDEQNAYIKDVFPNMDVLLVHGHTDAMMIPHIRFQGRTVVYMADLLPSVHHVPLPWVMAYDTRPLLTMVEKAAFMERAAKGEFVLFLEHDPVHECATVELTEKGVRLASTMPLIDLG